MKSQNSLKSSNSLNNCESESDDEDLNFKDEKESIPSINLIFDANFKTDKCKSIDGKYKKTGGV